MNERLVATVAWRFLQGRRTRLLDGAARSALGATAIGVTAMVVAMALMSGYRDSLQKKLTQDRAAVMAYPLTESAFEVDAGRRAAVLAVEDVRGLRRVGYGQGSIRTAARPSGVDVTLRGVDRLDTLEGLGLVERFELLESGGDAPEISRILVGRELLRQLAPEDGEVLRLLALGARDGRPKFSYRSVRVAGTFSSGFSEFDQRLVILDRSTLEELTGAAVGETIFEVLVADASRSGEIAEQVRSILGPDYLVMDWPELNRELFTALEVQKVGLFLLLGLIVLVSTFNVASSLLVLVRERTRDIGVLAAVGLSPRSLQRLFLLYGGGLSLGGVILGVTAGTLTAWMLTRWELIRFDPELAAVYFLSSVPLYVRPVDVLTIVGFTFMVTVAACWLPARRLGRIQPASALRAE